MIQLEVNGTQQVVQPVSIAELQGIVGKVTPPGDVCSLVRVNGMEIDESRLEDFEIPSIRTLEIQTSHPTQLARESVSQTQEWIGRISKVLRSISDDYRLGRNQEGADKLVPTVDALQVLIGLLQGIYQCIDIDTIERSALEPLWEETKMDLLATIQGLIGDMESGDPIRLADSTGHALPRSLGRFTDLLGKLPS